MILGPLRIPGVFKQSLKNFERAIKIAAFEFNSICYCITKGRLFYASDYHTSKIG